MENGGGQGKRLGEIYEINRRFLDLIALHADTNGDGKYGLPGEICRQIAQLSTSQRDVVAMVPMLMVTAAHRTAADISSVHDSQASGSRLTEDVKSAEQNFAASLLTWMIQDVQQNHSLSSLWLSASGSRQESIRDLGFGDIQILARYADRILAACFTDRPRLWNDLVRAARSNNPRRQEHARLAALSRSCPPQFIAPARGMRDSR